MSFLLDGFMAVTWQQIVMYIVGILLIYLAIKKEYEPSLLLPMGFGAILVNLPFSGVLNQTIEGIGEVQGIIQWLYDLGIGASEAMPLLLFIGIGAMIDFGPLLSNPKMFLFGAAAQFGIFFAVIYYSLFNHRNVSTDVKRVYLPSKNSSTLSSPPWRFLATIHSDLLGSALSSSSVFSLS